MVHTVKSRIKRNIITLFANNKNKEGILAQ